MNTFGMVLLARSPAAPRAGEWIDTCPHEPEERPLLRRTLSQIMKMTRLTSSLGIAAIGAASLVSTASAAPEQTVVHELRGYNSFTATRTSKALVRFPGRTPARDLRTTFDGDGRVYGFRLQKTGHYESESLRPEINNITVGRCKQRACRAHRRIGLPNFGDLGDTLSGTWDLYVIADGAPVTVTMKLAGISGRTSAHVTHRITSRIETLTPMVHEGNGKNLYSAGSFSPIPEADLAFVGLWFRGDTHAASRFGDCAYNEGDVTQPPREELAFLPGCPTGDGFDFSDTDQYPGRFVTQFTSIRDGCCTNGIGAWYEGAAMIKYAGAVALYMQL